MHTYYSQPALRWILFRSACYLGKEGATFGPAIVPQESKAIGINSVCVDVANAPYVDIVGDTFRMFTSGGLQHVFLGKRFEQIDRTEAFLKEMNSKLAVGGHLILHHDSVQSTKHKYTPEQLVGMVGEAGRFRLKTQIVREGQILCIFKKLEGKRGIIDTTHDSRPAKTACIARYGAIGDMIMLTPLMKQLKADGYHVTMNISPYAAPVISHNPNWDNLVVQEREMIPNLELGNYWKEWQGEYDRYINMSESLEGKLLKVEGRPDFFTSKEFRIRTGNFNYYDQTMKLGGYPNITGTRGELFFTAAEERAATKFFAPYRNKFIIVWAINGSSHHKMHASLSLMIEDWLVQHDDSIIITTGDAGAPPVYYDHNRLLKQQGQWTIRESLIATKYANVVIGPESMMLNAAACYDTPKITFMSHSTPEALCKYWTNSYPLEPDQELAPCYPCFQLHFTKESCPMKQAIDKETKEVVAMAPSCAMNAISPERVIAQLEMVYQKHFNGAKPQIVV